MKKTAMLSTLLLAGTLLAGSNLALAHKDGPFRDGERPPVRMQLARMAWVLDLSPEQKEQMRTILHQSHEKMHALRQQDRDVRHQLHDLARTDAPDEATLAALLDQAAQLHRQKLEARIHTRQQLNAVLTEAQREQWRQWREEHPRGKGGRPIG